MKWLSAEKFSPNNKEEVLLRCNGKFLLVIYDAKTKVFKDRNGSTYTSKDSDLRWCRLISPVTK